MLDRGVHKFANFVFYSATSFIKELTHQLILRSPNFASRAGSLQQEDIDSVTAIVRPFVTFCISDITRSLHAKTPRAYILESELELLTSKTREAILQAAYSERITKTMYYSYTLGKEGHSLKKPARWIKDKAAEKYAQVQALALERTGYVDTLAEYIARTWQDNNQLTNEEKKLLTSFFADTRRSTSVEERKATTLARWLVHEMSQNPSTEAATWKQLQQNASLCPLWQHVASEDHARNIVFSPKDEARHNIQGAIDLAKSLEDLTSSR